MCGAIAPAMPQSVFEATIRSQRQTIRRDRWPAGITAQAFETRTVVGRHANAGVKVDSSQCCSLRELARFELLDSNAITDVSSLVTLDAATQLRFEYNQIEDISAFAAGYACAAAPIVFFRFNLLDAGDCPDVNLLKAAGCSVSMYSQFNCSSP